MFVEDFAALVGRNAAGAERAERPKRRLPARA